MCFGSDAEVAHNFVPGVMGWMLQGLDHAGRQTALDILNATLSAHDTGHGVFYESATWVIQAR